MRNHRTRRVTLANLSVQNRHQVLRMTLSIAIGLAAVGMPGKESLILQGVIKYCVLFTIIGGLVCYLMPMIL